MIEFQGAAALGGYVRAVFSARVNGYAAPADLIRAQLKTSARVALRARMRSAFSGYLATDSDDDDLALRRLEIYGRKYEAKAAPFSSRRAWYSGHSDDLCMTVDSDPLDSRYRALTGGPLDAPGCLPGGACDSLGALFGGSPQVVALREYISDEVPEPFAPGREKHAGGVDRLCSTGFWFVNMEQCGALDAPQFIAAGSFRAFEDRDCGTVRAPRILMRAGWL